VADAAYFSMAATPKVVDSAPILMDFVSLSASRRRQLSLRTIAGLLWFSLATSFYHPNIRQNKYKFNICIR
jgi:hypothetical protein